MAYTLDDIGNAPGQAYDFLKRKYISFTEPDKDGDYSSRKSSIARQEKLAEMLSQMGAQEQAVSTAGGITAPMSGMGALARGLTSFGGSYLSGKAAADAAALEKVGKEELVKAISGFGKPYKTVDETAPTDVEPGGEPIAQYTLKTPSSQDKMAEAARIMESGYPGGSSIGQALLKSEIESRNKGEEYSTTPVYNAKGEAFQLSKSGGAPRPVPGVTIRDAWSMGMNENQKAQYDIDIAKYGIEYANTQLAQNRGAFEGIGSPGMQNITPPSALRRPSASPAAPTTAPITQPTIPAQPSGNIPGAMPRTAAPSQVVRPPTKPNAASADVPLTDPRNPAYKDMAPKFVQENITKLNLERATAIPQVNSQLATLYNLRNTVNNLYTHPSLGGILGLYDQFETLDTTPGTINARASYNQLFSQTAITQIQAMRDASKTGGAVGQVTEGEWDKLSNAALAMSLKQSPEDFKIGLANYKNTLNQIEDKLRGSYKSIYGGKIDFNPPEYKTYAESHNIKNKPSNTASAKPSSARSAADAILAGD